MLLGIFATVSAGARPLCRRRLDPLEALRLGCETYALDYNPVAVLINKAVLEFPQRFGRPGQVKNVPLPWPAPKDQQAFLSLLESTAEKTQNPLLQAVSAWGQWVLEEARKELEAFYPKDPDGSIPVGYIWARTLPCQNPTCGAEIPLMRQTWLAKKDKRQIAFKLIPDRAARRIAVEIVEGSRMDFDPKKGTVSRARVRCPLCGGVIDDKTTRRLFREGKSEQRLMAVVLHHPKRSGKTYRLPTVSDLEAYSAAEQALVAVRQRLAQQWGMDPVPDEPLPLMSGVFNVPIYGMSRWGDLFNARQKLALVTFADKVRQAHAQMLAQGADSEFAKAVVTYLTYVISRLADWNSVLSIWRPDQERNEHVFNRQALPMVWDYGERNPCLGKLISTGTIKDILAHLTGIPPANSQSPIPNSHHHPRHCHRPPLARQLL